MWFKKRGRIRSGDRRILKVYHIDPILENYVCVHTDVNHRKLIFLVDSGSDISLIKEDSLFYLKDIDRHDIIKIQGISEDYIEALGSLQVDLSFSNLVCDQKFILVDSDFPIPHDGIIGRDFLKKYRVSLEYGEDDYLYFRNDDLSVPIVSTPFNDRITIPSRCEVVRKINLPSSDDFVVSDTLENSQVFIARAIINQKSPFVRLINLSTSPISISVNTIRLEPLSDFHIVSQDISKRTAEVLDILKKNFPKHIHTSLRSKLNKLCVEYAQIFGLKHEPITCNNFYKQKIELVDKNPVYTPQYKLNHSQLKIIEEQVDKLLKDRIIRHSKSNYNNPIILVPKHSKNGEKWRLVVDFRNLNKKLIKDKYPLPRIDRIFDQLGHSKFFSVCDLMSGFHNIELEEDSRKYTAFTTHKGFYEFNRLPFGLAISPNSFCRMMAIAFAHLTPDIAFLYVDDIIVLGRTEEEHLNNLRKVFDVCLKHNLKLNPDKCTFFRPEVSYLGHTITANGILPDKSKFNLIRDYPTPKSSDDVKRFVAFANYYRKFVKNFAELTYHLNQLTRKNVLFKWTSIHDNAFMKIKHILCNSPLLTYPDFEQPFYLTTDASNIACGAVLSQMKDKVLKPIAFASRTFTQGEQHKSVIEKELTAIHFAVNYFKPYLFGYHFFIQTDHKPLVYLFSLKNPSSKLNRIRLDLMDFDFTIEYIKGENNPVADALSRISINTLKDKYKQVLMMTRSKTLASKSKQRQSETISVSENHDEPNIYFETNNNIIRKFPEIKFNFARNCAIIGYAMHRHKPQIITEILFKEHDIFLKDLAKINGNNKVPQREGANYEDIWIPGLNYDKSIAHVASADIEALMIRSAANPQCDNEAGQARKCITQKMAIPGNIINKNNGQIIQKILKIIYDTAVEKKLMNIKINTKDELLRNLKTNELHNYEKILNSVKIILYDSPLQIKNKKMQKDIIKNYHDSIMLSGHSGFQRLYSLLKSKYNWKNMVQNVKAFTKTCQHCQLNKPSFKILETLQLTTTPIRAFDEILIDTYGPLPSMNVDGFKYLLTMQCSLTKFIIIGPMKDKTADSIARCIFNDFVSIHGFMKSLRSDLGTEFNNDIVGCLTKFGQIGHNFSAGYRPQTIGSLERNHRRLNEFLRIYRHLDSTVNWVDLAKCFAFCYNSIPNPLLNHYSPYELVYGRKPNLPDFIKNNTIEPIYDLDHYAKELKFNLQKSNAIVKNFVEQQKIVVKRKFDEQANPINIQINDQVKLTNDAKKTKLDQLYVGPFTVTDIQGKNAIITRNNKNQKVHKNRLSKYY